LACASRSRGIPNAIARKRQTAKELRRRTSLSLAMRDLQVFRFSACPTASYETTDGRHGGVHACQCPETASPVARLGASVLKASSCLRPGLRRSQLGQSGQTSPQSGRAVVSHDALAPGACSLKATHMPSRRSDTVAGRRSVCSWDNENCARFAAGTASRSLEENRRPVTNLARNFFPRPQGSHTLGCRCIGVNPTYRQGNCGVRSLDRLARRIGGGSTTCGATTGGT
jgi:hypothetical protein